MSKATAKLRVIVDPHLPRVEWAAPNGIISQRTRNSSPAWYHAVNGGFPERFQPTKERILMWADLLAQPEETEVAVFDDDDDEDKYDDED